MRGCHPPVAWGQGEGGVMAAASPQAGKVLKMINCAQ